jgi:hypothetical protein
MRDTLLRGTAMSKKLQSAVKSNVQTFEAARWQRRYVSNLRKNPGAGRKGHRPSMARAYTRKIR